MRVVGHFNYVQEPETVHATFTDRECRRSPGPLICETFRIKYEHVVDVN